MNLEEERSQTEFDFLLPGRSPQVTPGFLAKAMGRDVQFVYQMIEEGRLEVFAPEDREKKRYTITRRSALILMAKQAQFDPSDIVERVADVVATFTPRQFARFLQQAAARRA